MKPTFDLIVTIVKAGHSEGILQATKKAGADGGTVIFGRGTGIHENKTILGIPIEPEKEIILTAVPGIRTEKVMRAIIQAGDLDTPGAGIAFVLELKRIEGICHLLKDGLACE